ncbi:hypothetical protein COLO4_36397 [Corchorus olitorius]|uniref:DUF4283 domain-containing protein n=1 Tax=Corchorus olitorius TaxID=93759 RepID=A0A1R3G970_9ROSI|nr:hypothetical protein COLO4_36397 [Corchorus olitorius]
MAESLKYVPPCKRPNRNPNTFPSSGFKRNRDCFSETTSTPSSPFFSPSKFSFTSIPSSKPTTPSFRMSSNFRRREPSWTKSSESDFSDENSDPALSRAIANAYRPRAWRGPIFPVYQEELTEGRILWRHCVLAYMFDIRVFSVNYLQSLIRREWRSTGAIQVVGCQGKFYIIFVENEADRDKIVRRGPYAFKGLFLQLIGGTQTLLSEILSLPGFQFGFKFGIFL